jgi:hypothetical protein
VKDSLEPRSLTKLAEVVRAQVIPWGPERAARVERNITRGRERSRLAVPLAQLALGGLGGLALLSSLTHVSRAIRDETPEHGAEVPAFSESKASTPEVATAESDPTELDRPVGDGGFVDGSD